MALYRVEFWVQEVEDKEAKCRDERVIESNSDRKIKSYVSNMFKFFPEFSTKWNFFGKGLDFDMWRRDIKESVLEDWRKNHVGGCKDLIRFVIVKKAVTPAANDVLKEQCDNKPYRVHTTY